jgi:predicted Fe-Mo cluster-binding NifX family protein
VSGPTTIPPGGPRPSGTTVAGRPAAGIAGTLSTSPSTGLLQGTLDGECVCPRCGTKVPHVRGTACYSIPCPRCGTPMIRDSTLTTQLGITMAQASAGNMMPSSAVTIAGEDSGSICIAASGPSMNDKIAPMFDRAPYFIIVGLGTCKVVANPNVDDQAGVGIQSAQLVVSEGAKAVITNDISVKALQELDRLRIKVYTGVAGTAQQGLEWYQNGRLTPSSLDEGNHDEHNGSSKGKGSSTSSKKL